MKSDELLERLGALLTVRTPRSKVWHLVDRNTRQTVCLNKPAGVSGDRITSGSQFALTDAEERCVSCSNRLFAVEARILDKFPEATVGEGHFSHNTTTPICKVRPGGKEFDLTTWEELGGNLTDVTCLQCLYRIRRLV